MPKFSKTELDAIEAKDAARRLVREVAELQAIATRSVDPYLWGRGITGEPSAKNRNYRASDDCWKLGLSNPGLAVAEYDGRKHMHSVKVTRDGSTTILPRSAFRKAHIASKQRATVIAEAPNRRMAGDMPSLMQGLDN